MIEATENQEKVFKIGRVYRLYNDELNYIGSTSLTLNNRLSQHESHYKMYLDGKDHPRDSFLIIQNGNYKIELLAEFQNIPERKLREIEQEFIDKTDCVNYNCSYREIINGKWYCKYCNSLIKIIGGTISRHEKSKTHQKNYWNKKYPNKIFKTKLSIIKKKLKTRIKINLTKKISP